MLHAYLLSVTLFFTCASWCFYGFSATNILTRCHSASFYFLLFLIPEKLQRKYSRNRQRKLFYEVLHKKTPEARRGHLGEAWWAHTTPRHGYPLGTPGRGVDHLVPPAPPFRLYIAPDAKTLGPSPKPPEKFRHRRHIETKFRGTEVSVPAPCRDGEVPPEGSPSTPPPSPSPLLTPMMRSE